MSVSVAPEYVTGFAFDGHGRGCSVTLRSRTDAVSKLLGCGMSSTYHFSDAARGGRLHLTRRDSNEQRTKNGQNPHPHFHLHWAMS
jgi:hypothetical protein